LFLGGSSRQRSDAMKRLLVAMADILQTSSSISAYELKTSGLADNLLVFLTHADSETSVSATADLKVGIVWFF
jgi:hypothetical protein